MNRFGRLLIPFAAALAVSANAFAVGGDKDNGGFHFSRTGHVLLNIAQAQLLSELTELVSKRPELVYQDERTCPLPIDFRQLRERLSVIDYDYNERSYGENPAGVWEERHFRINEKNRVEAMRLYFEQYSTEYNRYKDAVTEDEKDKVTAHVRTLVLHEVLHTFKYNELKGRDCAPVVSAIVESYSPEKMSRWTTQAQTRNLSRTIYELNKSDCYSDDWQKEMQFAWTHGYSLKKYGPDKRYLSPGAVSSLWRIGVQVVACMVKSGYQIKAQFNQRDITLEGGVMKVGGQPEVGFNSSLATVGAGIIGGRSVNEVASALNQVVLFDFVSPLPQPK